MPPAKPRAQSSGCERKKKSKRAPRAGTRGSNGGSGSSPAKAGAPLAEDFRAPVSAARPRPEGGSIPNGPPGSLGDGGFGAGRSAPGRPAASGVAECRVGCINREAAMGARRPGFRCFRFAGGTGAEIRSSASRQGGVFDHAEAAARRRRGAPERREAGGGVKPRRSFAPSHLRRSSPSLEAEQPVSPLPHADSRRGRPMRLTSVGTARNSSGNFSMKWFNFFFARGAGTQSRRHTKLQPSKNGQPHPNGVTGRASEARPPTLRKIDREETHEKCPMVQLIAAGRAHDGTRTKAIVTANNGNS